MFEHQWGKPSRTPHKYIVAARQYVYMLACIDFGNHKQFGTVFLSIPEPARMIPSVPAVYIHVYKF